MKKLRLEVDALEVESFEAVSANDDPGTVLGLGWTPGCDSVRICGPNDPSYDPCTETGVPCWDTSDAVCTLEQGGCSPSLGC